jgi:uncharacterized membrane protein YfcA
MDLLEQETIAMLAGAGAGVLGAILGTGGGVFLIPILVLGLGVPIHHAVATSLVSVVATSCAVASTNVERGLANMRLGMVLEIATSLGAITGGLTAGLLDQRTLMRTFAVVLMPTAILMWRGRTDGDVAEVSGTVGGAHPDSTVPPRQDVLGGSTGRIGGRYDDPAEGGEVVYRVRRLWAGLLVSLLAGNLSGLLGIGGGVFKVPALHLLCGVPMKAAAATSNFMIGVTAAASSFLYYGRGEVELVLTAATVLGVLAGSALGTILNRHVRPAAARRLFALLLAAVAVQMLHRSWASKG